MNASTLSIAEVPGEQLSAGISAATLLAGIAMAVVSGQLLAGQGAPAPTPDPAPAATQASAVVAQVDADDTHEEPEPEEVKPTEVPSDDVEDAPAVPAPEEPQECAPVFEVYFDDGLQPQSDFEGQAQTLVAWLEAHPEKLLLVQGHADSKGDENYNLRLSFGRARHVAGVLRDAGLNDARFTVRGLGEYQPKSGVAEDARVQRRVSTLVEGTPACTAAGEVQ